MSKVLQSLPVGERVGIAFSGGLDTSVAVAWMRDKGADPLHLHRRPRSARRGRHRRDPGPRARVRRRALAPRRLQDRPRRRGLRRPRVRRLPHPLRRQAPTSTPRPLGRAVTGTLLVRAMKEDGVDIWGDGSTYKGNDIERFYRYGLLANPALRIYKPWLDADFVTELGGRQEMSEWLVEHGFPYRDSRREGVLDRREHLGRDARGEDPRAPRRLARDRRADHGRAVLGSGRRDRDRGRHGHLRARPPRRAQRRRVRRLRSRSCSRRTASAAATASA